MFGEHTKENARIILPELNRTDYQIDVLWFSIKVYFISRYLFVAEDLVNPESPIE